MAASIRDELNQFYALSQMGQNRVNNLQIISLRVGADVVDLACAALHQDIKNRSAMIIDVNPIAHIEPVPVNW